MTFTLKTLFCRIVVNEENFTYRNIWGKQRSYRFSDVISISVKPKYYVINFADDIITVYRLVTTSNYMRFLDEAASRGVQMDEKP